MGAGDLEHAGADVARGDHVVAEQHQEALAGNGVGHRADGVAQPLGLVLVAEVHGQVAGLGNGVGVAVLAALAKQRLQRAVGLEVAEQLGLAGRGHDDGAVDLLGLQRLLDHVLDDRLVEHREHLLGGALGRRQEAGAEAGCGDDSLHGLPFVHAFMTRINNGLFAHKQLSHSPTGYRPNACALPPFEKMQLKYAPSDYLTRPHQRIEEAGHQKRRPGEPDLL